MQGEREEPSVGQQRGRPTLIARRPSRMPVPAPPARGIECRILLVRGQKVTIDVDLAELYGVPTKPLSEQVKQTRERFPEDWRGGRGFEVAICDLKHARGARRPPAPAVRLHRAWRHGGEGSVRGGALLRRRRASSMSLEVEIRWP